MRWSGIVKPNSAAMFRQTMIVVIQGQRRARLRSWVSGTTSTADLRDRTSLRRRARVAHAPVAQQRTFTARGRDQRHLQLQLSVLMPRVAELGKDVDRAVRRVDLTTLRVVGS